MGSQTLLAQRGNYVELTATGEADPAAVIESAGFSVKATATAPAMPDMVANLSITSGDGTAMLTTVSGGKLTAMMNGDHNIVLKDEKGNVANISTYDVYQSNGVIHVIDTVLMPK